MKLHAYRYRLPFANPLVTSKTAFRYREGLFLEAVTGKLNFFAEAAPLPGYSVESIEEVVQLVHNTKREIVAALATVDPIASLERLYNEKLKTTVSLQFALDTLAYQIEATQSSTPLQKYLFHDAQAQIPANTIVSLQKSNFLQEIENKTEEGFNTLKFKVGIEFEQEFKRLRTIRSKFPDLVIRVDANQAWSLAEAMRNCEKLADIHVEYCEEPVIEATPKNFEILSQHCNLPLAIDESVLKTDFWPNLLPFSSYIILKPMLLGSFKRIFETKRLADTHENKTVITTSLESGIGRAMTTILASGIGAPATAHGLATGSLLGRDVHSKSIYFNQGVYQLNNQLRSLGINRQKLEEVSTNIF
ncbi:MAG: enolase C-terminal domain-like protein [Balneolaceae bacterium]|jgi:o-succinylbenzoate synthase